jgi:hypothetical protein
VAHDAVCDDLLRRGRDGRGRVAPVATSRREGDERHQDHEGELDATVLPYRGKHEILPDRVWRGKSCE